MINWNQNDTKYILKRILLYLIIGGIVFCFGSRCAKAEVSTVGKDYTQHSGNYWIITLSGQLGKGKGQGWVIGNAFVNPSGSINYGVKDIFATVVEDNSNNQYDMVCEIGSTTGWTDNTNYWINYTYKCPVNLGSHQYVRYITIEMITSSNEQVYGSSMFTYVNENSDAQSIINANNQAIQNQINANNTNAQAIQNAISQSTTSTVNAINNQTSAINDNTQAIEDLNDTITSGLDPQIPTDFLDGLDGLFVTGDDNIIRGILMLPLDIFVIIYNAVTSDSCTTYSFGSLYNVNLSMPCINWKNIVGNGLYVIIDTIMGSALLFGIYRFLKMAIKHSFTIGADAGQTCVEVFK